MEARIGWNFAAGQLQLIGEDGSSLLLDADTDDAASVSITINNDSGVDSFDAPWSLWQRALRFDAYPMESPGWVSAERLASAQPDAGPAITEENYAALLGSIFALFSGQKALAPLVQAQRFMTGMEPRAGSGIETTNREGVFDIQTPWTSWQADFTAAYASLCGS